MYAKAYIPFFYSYALWTLWTEVKEGIIGVIERLWYSGIRVETKDRN